MSYRPFSRSFRRPGNSGRPSLRNMGLYWQTPPRFNGRSPSLPPSPNSSPNPVFLNRSTPQQGKAGALQTLQLMAELARSGSQTAAVRNKAVSLTKRLLQKDFRGEACACLGFVRDQIRYVRDIYDVETIAAPAWLLQIGAGDCDDKATLLA